MCFLYRFNFPVRVEKHRQQKPQRVVNRGHLFILRLPGGPLQRREILPDQLRVSQAHIGHAVQQQRRGPDLRAGAVEEALALPRRVLVLRLKIMMGCQSNRPFFLIRKGPDHGFRPDACERLP